jgi:hypothetical protein
MKKLTSTLSIMVCLLAAPASANDGTGGLELMAQDNPAPQITTAQVQVRPQQPREPRQPQPRPSQPLPDPRPGAAAGTPRAPAPAACAQQAAMLLAGVEDPRSIRDFGRAADTGSAPYHCDRMHVSIDTYILPRPDPEMSNACRSAFEMELYFSGSREAIESLPRLQREARAGDLQLPANVGRMVENPSRQGNRWPDGLYVRRLGGFTNSHSFEAVIPPHAFDYDRPRAVSSADQVAYSRAVSAQQFRAGTTLHYRWAKRIFIPSGDSLVFGGIHSFTVPARNKPPSVKAVPHPNITLPVNTATIQANVSDADGRIANVTWSYIPGRNPLPAPVIESPNSPSTRVIVSEWGGYEFEVTATDNCGTPSSDRMMLIVDRPASERPTKFRTRVESGRTCDAPLNASVLELVNPTQNRMRVTLLETNDYRNWRHPDDNFSGQLINSTYDMIILPGSRIELACSARRGTGTRGHLYSLVSYRITAERQE